ncbi:MAG: symmetrical bis(5'-nucleosyl)-tetraphosphatase [Pseudohongiellaceae bacterium]
MATYAVGDIQGCYDQLRQLLDKVHFSPGIDRLWGVGDMINRGPQSLETLRFLKQLGTNYTGILGNHDLHFLALASGAFKNGKMTSLLPLIAAPDSHELFEWVRNLPLAHVEKIDTTSGRKKFLMIHAGIAPGWKFKQTLGYAREVASALQGPDYLNFLQQMYGDLPATFSEQLKGMERLRVITNTLTRLRFCTATGRMNLKLTTGPDTATKNFLPWYEYQQLKPDRVLLFGHWATLDGITGKDNIHALDSGCVWGRCLTLLRLEDGERISVQCNDL